MGQAKGHSTTHRRGNSSKPFMSASRSTIFDVHDQAPQFVKAIAKPKPHLDTQIARLTD
jgi:hypothetical protein